MEIIIVNATIWAVIVLLIMAIYVLGLLLTAFLSTIIPFEGKTIASNWTKEEMVRCALFLWPITWIFYIIYYFFFCLAYRPIRYGESIIHNGLNKRGKQKDAEGE